MSLLLCLSSGYMTKSLTLTDLPAVMALQEIVIDHLPSNQKNFIIPKNAEQFTQRMTTLGQMYGIFLNEPYKPQLIAYGGVAFPTKGWPSADMILSPGNLPWPPEHLAVIQSSAVHPDYRSMGMNKLLIAVREEVCHQKKKRHIMSEVAAANPASLKGFLVYGHQVTHTSIDPEDGCPLLYTHKKLNCTTPSTTSKGATTLDPATDFDRITALLSEEHVGVSMKRGNGEDQYTLLIKPLTYG